MESWRWREGSTPHAPPVAEGEVHLLPGWRERRERRRPFEEVPPLPQLLLPLRPAAALLRQPVASAEVLLAPGPLVPSGGGPFCYGL